MTPDQILDDAADIIEKKGWWDGDENTNAEDARCVWLAIQDVSAVEAKDVFLTDICPTMLDALREHDRIRERAIMALASYLGLDLTTKANGTTDLTPLFDWNDGQESGTPVIDAMRHAAKVLRGG